MATDRLNPDLERRIAALEVTSNQGAEFTAVDWIWLIVLGIIGPGLLLIWGWMP